jgi:two-component system, cell cycle sensor histidine kinase and response regulator CckA
VNPREPVEGVAAAPFSARTVEAVGQLTAAAAHEFKNLLLVISGITDLVLERTDLELSARSDLEEIRRATEQADQLAQRLVALVQKPTARPRAVAPNQLLLGFERLLGRLLGEKIVLRVELAQDLGCVFVDPVELQQAVLNLVLNARDALSQGGELRISTGRVELTPSPPGSLRPGRYVALRVSDDGAGMDDQTRAHLFEPYFTTKDPGRGSGLGLSLVRGFVRRAGGEVQVRSGLGAGTTVELLLPELEAGAVGG